MGNSDERRIDNRDSTVISWTGKKSCCPWVMPDEVRKRRENRGRNKKTRRNKNSCSGVFLLYFNSVAWFVYISRNVERMIKPPLFAHRVHRRVSTRVSTRSRCKNFITLYERGERSEIFLIHALVCFPSNFKFLSRTFAFTAHQCPLNCRVTLDRT